MKYNLKEEFKIEQAQHYLDKLIEKEAKIELREIRPKRSIKQNALYWLWLTAIEQESQAGLRKGELHILFRAKFLPKPDEYITEIILPDLWERIREKVNSFYLFKGLEDIINIISFHTPEQDSGGMTQYMNKIKDYAFENMGVELLTEDEKNFIEFINYYQQ